MPNLRRLALTVAFIACHVVPLLLASTAFTLITAPLGRSALSWSYLDCAYQNGWGYIYHSDYSISQVLAYLIAYGSGLIFYPILARPRFVRVVACLVCIIGLASFTIELSHWFFDHHLSLIGSFPVILLLAAIWTIISLWWKHPVARPVVGIQAQ